MIELWQEVSGYFKACQAVLASDPTAKDEQVINLVGHRPDQVRFASLSNALHYLYLSLLLVEDINEK